MVLSIKMYLVALDGDEVDFDGLTDLCAPIGPVVRDGLETEGFWADIN